MGTYLYNSIDTGQSCQWTRHRAGKEMGYGPIYDWSCQLIPSEKQGAKKDRLLTTKAIVNEEKCPVRCHELKNCADCLSSNGSEGMGQVKLRNLKK